MKSENKRFTFFSFDKLAHFLFSFVDMYIVKYSHFPKQCRDSTKLQHFGVKDDYRSQTHLFFPALVLEIATAKPMKAIFLLSFFSFANNQ